MPKAAEPEVKVYDEMPVETDDELPQFGYDDN